MRGRQVPRPASSLLRRSKNTFTTPTALIPQATATAGMAAIEGSAKWSTSQSTGAVKSPAKTYVHPAARTGPSHRGHIRSGGNGAMSSANAGHSRRRKYRAHEWQKQGFILTSNPYRRVSRPGLNRKSRHHR